MKWALLATGVALLCFTFYAALSIKDDLQLAHLSTSTAASALSVFPFISLNPATAAGHVPADDDASDNTAGATLPLFLIVLTVAAHILVVYGGAGALFTLHPVERKAAAATASYDEVIFSGNDFVHFNHRGRAINSSHATR